MMKFLSKSYIFIIFALLYAPIAVVVLFSFNQSESLSEFTGFTADWYIELFQDEVALDALKNSLVLAVCSAITATVIGTFAALGIHNMRKKFVKGWIKSITNIPMVNPDIVTGISMMLLFVTIGLILKKLFDIDISLGFWSMLIAHTTFNLPYVLLSVLPRFNQLDRSLSEAAMDLGCTPTKAFFLVELPQIVPGIVSGMMLAFTMSLDDFVISHFVSSPNFQTLPLYVYNQTAHNVKFSMYALCAMIIAIILVILLIVNFTGSVSNKKKQPRKGARS